MWIPKWLRRLFGLKTEPVRSGWTEADLQWPSHRAMPPTRHIPPRPVPRSSELPAPTRLAPPPSVRTPVRRSWDPERPLPPTVAPPPRRRVEREREDSAADDAVDLLVAASLIGLVGGAPTGECRADEFKSGSGGDFGGGGASGSWETREAEAPEPPPADPPADAPTSND